MPIIILYGLIVFIFIAMGTIYLVDYPVMSVYYFVIALYFFVVLFEFRGKPFSRHIYLLVSLLLISSALLQFFGVKTSDNHLIYGFVSLFFAYFALQARKRLRQ